MNQASKIIAYTDGSCLKNPDGPGGWAVVLLIDGEKQIHASGFSPRTTNNRMEMTAALSALRLIQKLGHTGSVEIRTDSEYVKNGMTAWISGWKRRGWISSSGKDVLNRDLWEEMDRERSGLDVTWTWVRGHAGNANNEIADRLAGMAAREQKGSYEEITVGAVVSSGDTPVKRSGAFTIDLDLTVDDRSLASAVRAALIAARGKSVRFRESQDV